MGQEANCEVRFGGKVSAGKALLETDDLIFRGDFRLSIPLKSIQSLEAADGVLRGDSCGRADFSPRGVSASASAPPGGTESPANVGTSAYVA